MLNKKDIINPLCLFRYSFIEDTFEERCSQIRVYVDSIIPINHLTAQVNIGVEVIIHNKLANIINNFHPWGYKSSMVYGLVNKGSMNMCTNIYIISYHK